MVKDAPSHKPGGTLLTSAGDTLPLPNQLLKNEFYEAVTNCCIQDLRTFSIADGQGFVKLIQASIDIGVIE